MTRFLLKHLLFLCLTLLVVSLIVFVMTEFTPGDVARKMLGAYATQEQVEILSKEMGLDRPVLARYLEYIGHLAQGDLGYSTRFKVPVKDIIFDRLANTGMLAAIAFAIIVPLSMLLGIAAGMRESSRFDRAIMLFSTITASIPEFAMGVFLASVFVVALGWLPGTATMTGSARWSVAQQLVLPVATIVLFDLGYLVSMIRASMVEVMQRPYIRTAVLKGMRFRQVILGHALRNAMINPVTVMLLQINYLITGVVVVETVFAYPGFGRMMLEAALYKDIALIEVGALVAVFVAVLTQILGDLGYMMLDPKDSRLMTAESKIDTIAAAPRRAAPVAWLAWLRRLAPLGESPPAMIGIALTLFWAVAALLAPWLAPYPPNASDLAALAHPTPSAAHWLGTDHLGRDILSRVLWGARTVLTVAPVAVLGATAFGSLVGLAAGYYRGWIDLVITRISDIVLSFPVIILYMIILAIYGSSALNIIAVITLTKAPIIARIVRGITLELREREYVAAAKMRGESALYIMLVEILPNARGPLIVEMCLRMGYTIITIGVLGFLGIGLPPPDPDWGGMVKDTYGMMSVWPHMSLIPCAVISSLVIGFNLLSIGLREIGLRD